MNGIETAGREPANPSGTLPPQRQVRVLLYGDVDLNIIDGSAVWLTSMAQTWSLAGAQVDVQLKAVEDRTLLSGELRSMPGVTVWPAHPPQGRRALEPAPAAEALQKLDGQDPYDVVMVRGIRICRQVARRGAFAGRLWSYVTEFGYPHGTADSGTDTGAERWQQLGEIAAASRLMLAQTEQARAVLEAMVPAAAGRTVVLSPMVPDAIGPSTTSGTSAASNASIAPTAASAAAPGPGGPVRLVYTGKFARRWRTDQMPVIVEYLRAGGVAAELTMVGDKVQHDPEHPDWAERMRAVMATPRPDVAWLGALDRTAALEAAARADITLGWRDEELDLSLELSTKVLESCALGVPPLVNRTAAHEELLGADYPLFVDGAEDGPLEIARRIAAVRDRLPELSARVLAVAEPYRMTARADTLKTWLARIGLPGPARTQRSRPVRVVVAGHDLKFAGELVDLLTDHPDVDLRLDHWSSLHHHDEASSRELVDWADVVMCEWAGPNAVWYAQHKKSGQRLVVRLHMFELRGRWLSELAADAVDRFVTVSEHYRDLVVEHLGLAAERVSVIPNAVSLADLDRPGLPGRHHRLGLVGMVPLRKRLDRAVDLLRELHRTDPRYTLHLRGRMPWEYPHEWRKPVQREAYMDLFARLGDDPVRHAVAFEPFGADMAGWLRKIGWVLSPSTVESFHLAPAEGMASGALPVLWERPGARDIFGDEFVVQDTAAAARLILETDADDDARAARQRTARERVAGFDERTVTASWQQVLLSGL
ncbi:glycosyltransferase family 4 protein [Citricoccus muralis]|uniref:Glycosyltransferase involved in cell wall biosynthesis n=1 Tax=Citricoccus muralis TaxID=169134 RepID=A0A3D9L8S1_9MICC|nr:glycosyltransferase family 4 protein [Citricoccus muralis]REE02759.1 glycosyltransferase involved in cell wall biosynthesis [Citricoccus muralis]